LKPTKQHWYNVDGFSCCQSQLPASGIVPTIPRRKSEQYAEQLQDYICTRTLSNWKYWIVSFLLQCTTTNY